MREIPAAVVTLVLVGCEQRQTHDGPPVVACRVYSSDDAQEAIATLASLKANFDELKTGQEDEKARAADLAKKTDEQAKQIEKLRDTTDSIESGLIRLQLSVDK